MTLRDPRDVAKMVLAEFLDTVKDKTGAHLLAPFTYTESDCATAIRADRRDVIEEAKRRLLEEQPDSVFFYLGTIVAILDSLLEEAPDEKGGKR